MAINGRWIEYDGLSGYFAAPDRAGEHLPAVVVIQEIWGVTEHIEDVTRRIAAAGYAALAPELLNINGVRPEPLTRERIEKTMGFMRQQAPSVWGNPAERGRELAKLPETDAVEIDETFIMLFGSPDRPTQYIPKLKKTVRHLRDVQPETAGQKVACVGFCMGGGLSALLACEEPDISGAAVFYGGTPPPEKIPLIQCPVIAFYGSNDQRVNAGIPLFDETMRGLGRRYEHFIYEGANHSFFNDSGQAYDVRAVRDSYVRLLVFLYGVLTGQAL